MNVSVLANHRLKLHENEKLEKFLFLMKERNRKFLEMNAISMITVKLGSVLQNICKKIRKIEIKKRTNTYDNITKSNKRIIATNL